MIDAGPLPAAQDRLGGRQSSFLLSRLFSYQYMAAAPIAAPITNVNISLAPFLTWPRMSTRPDGSNVTHRGQAVKLPLEAAAVSVCCAAI